MSTFAGNAKLNVTWGTGAYETAKVSTDAFAISMY
jgi:hypothetical protein